MRLVFVRHGDPDYVHDSLTERGVKEAECLHDRVAKWPITHCFASPLGRAQQTARIALEGTGIVPETLDWLEELPVRAYDPDTGELRHGWDWTPEYFTSHPELYDKMAWTDADIYKDTCAGEVWRRTVKGIDEVLARYGYVRRVPVEGDSDARKRIASPAVYDTPHTGTSCAGHALDDITLVFFCHFGITSAVLGHLLGASPVFFIQTFFCPPTSVTVVAAEEVRPGVAGFRCQTLGDSHHLLVKGVEVSPSGYFTDTFSF